MNTVITVPDDVLAYEYASIHYRSKRYRTLAGMKRAIARARISSTNLYGIRANGTRVMVGSLEYGSYYGVAAKPFCCYTL